MPFDTPWHVPEEVYPAAGTSEEKLRFMLNYAVLAPSGHNTQPWSSSDARSRTWGLVLTAGH